MGCERHLWFAPCPRSRSASRYVESRLFKMPRQNFSVATKIKLAQRVCYRCSNPQCSRPTIGPSTEDGESASIGVAAHIHAASSGGPRYNSNQSDYARASHENGIWLCQSCSRLVDIDFEGYSAAQLTEWKSLAESAARLRYSDTVLLAMRQL